MKINKSTTAAFTGYRTIKILRSASGRDIIEKLYLELNDVIEKLCEEGYDTFLSGMAEGFDMLAAEAVLKVKMKRANIRLIAVVPFLGQESGYFPRDKKRYQDILHSADKVVITSDTYHKKAFFVRNDYMIQNSSLIVCYYDGQRGGTMYTYNRALRNNMKIINLNTTANLNLVNG